jgi:hypothetical protein
LKGIGPLALIANLLSVRFSIKKGSQPSPLASGVNCDTGARDGSDEEDVGVFPARIGVSVGDEATGVSVGGWGVIVTGISTISVTMTS